MMSRDSVQSYGLADYSNMVALDRSRKNGHFSDLFPIRKYKHGRITFGIWQNRADEAYANINVQMHYLWGAVDHEAEILESHVTKIRDKAAALAFMKKALNQHGSPAAITTDGLGSYKAAMKTLGNNSKQEVGLLANNRVENSHLPFRLREPAMLQFRQLKSLKKCASLHANLQSHFKLERHLVRRDIYKERRSALQRSLDT